jgi:T5orf172 domain
MAKTSRSNQARHTQTKQTTEEDLALLAELGIDTTTPEPPKRTPREERIIAGFEDIERFIEEHGRLPQHGDDHDIFERLYAVRLDRLRELDECRELLRSLDARGLLDASTEPLMVDVEQLDDAALLAELGVNFNDEDDLTQLKYVRSRQEIKAAEEIAQRSPCPDFSEFKPLFKQVKTDLKIGERKTVKYQDDATINPNDLFILEGHTILVAEAGEPFMSDYGLQNRRLRVVYDNGTESDLLLRSLQRALNKDKNSRRITKMMADYGPLFDSVELTPPAKVQTNHEVHAEITTGYIYVLRSLSNHAFIAEHRAIIHKIGVTTGDVKKRIANAKKDATYLLADVEIVTTFKLTQIHPHKLEALLHKFFDCARLDLQFPDRFGTLVKPREWFFVPLAAIKTAIQAIQDGTIDHYTYNPETAALELTDP